ncbi:Hypothetical protein PHPALM_16997 [Phytophthora palmivora]|uniref:Uncharacterized protein n=1 Tax=Phytophthora palmivora TaxID=4796 RepID=A0A2P4XNB5_9STRA|nr:Hypothetical protein PHPALM_16997 [Phytophthora palmivora]
MLFDVEHTTNWDEQYQRKVAQVAKNNERENAKRRSWIFAPKDKVLLRNDAGPQAKMAQLFSGPYEIIDVRTNGALVLDKGRYMETVHIRRVVPFKIQTWERLSADEEAVMRATKWNATSTPACRAKDTGNPQLHNIKVVSEFKLKTLFPFVDCFNNNLIIHRFGVVDITSKRNNLYFYGEHAQGKGADNLSTLQRDAQNGAKPAENSFSLLDNCVGQTNQSGLDVFCDVIGVVLIEENDAQCLLPGHSHSIVDRTIAWCRYAIF